MKNKKKIIINDVNGLEMNENKEVSLDDLEIDIKEQIKKERERYYDIFEKQTGKKAIWRGQETRLFENWYENLILKDSESIKCIVRYFADENSMICQDFQLKTRDLELDDNNNMVWSLTEKSKQHILNDIAYTILSIPIFHVVSSHKYSVKFILDKNNDDLYDYGCSSFDQYNKLHSDILAKNLKSLIGKLFSKWTVYFVIFLFSFLITCLPFFPITFPKYFGN